MCVYVYEREMEADEERHGRNHMFSNFISKYKFYPQNISLEKRSRREVIAGLSLLPLSFILPYVMDNFKLITYGPVMKSNRK